MRIGVALALLLLLTATLTATPAATQALTGINLAGAEFGGLKSVHGKGYIYPDMAQMRAFRDRGMNVFRVPLRWERIQPVLNAPLDAAEAARLDKVVAYATGMNVAVIIDIHNYARYARQPLGSANVPVAALRDLWVRLAVRYKGNDKVIFGLMNEPVRLSAADWAAAAQNAVNGIRATGARNLVLVPGAAWSGAHSWTKPIGLGASNGEALAGFKDPAGNMAFDFHQYFDANSSGTTTGCIAPAAAAAKLAVATNWLRAHRRRGMLTEFGVSQNPECAAVLTAALTHMAANPEWLGWTIWASSAWFGSYPFNLYPLQRQVPPQLQLLQPFLAIQPQAQPQAEPQAQP